MNAIRSQSNEDGLERDIDSAIKACYGDMRAAVRALLIANSFLESALAHATAKTSVGFMRKGQSERRLSAAQVHDAWPYQVVISSERCRSDDYHRMYSFCVGRSLAPRGHAVSRDADGGAVFCFAIETDAEMFRSRFGGNMLGGIN
jgi:hypothetical protein